LSRSWQDLNGEMYLDSAFYGGPIVALWVRLQDSCCVLGWQ
jgi:hypothetical protein